jgi:hypothetical protein
MTVVGLFGLAACASEPARLASAPEPSPAESRSALHAAASAHSAAYERAGRLRLAVWWRSVAESLAEDPAPDARIKTALSAEIARQVRAELVQARDCAGRGQGEKAALHFERALELDPGQEQARAELRRLDRIQKLKQIRSSGAGGP